MSERHSSERQFVTVHNPSSNEFGDINLNVAIQGTGPLILCIHGWPEIWYSWRHQMEHFSAQGYTVAAMDVRGYGGSSKPYDISAYTLRELCSDAAAVIDELGDGQAIVLGHDWGAPIAWNTARLHPEKVSAVCGMSVPYFPVSADNPLDKWREIYDDNDKFFYQTYFEAEGVGEAELEVDSLRSLRMIYYGACGASRSEPFIAEKPANSTMLDGMIDPDPFPAWCSDEDLQIFADAMTAGGWRGPLNRYRAQPFDAADIGQLANPNLTQPAAFIGGEHDVVRKFNADVDPYDWASLCCDDFRGTTLIPRAGHWVQQEEPDATNAALEAFFASLK